MFLLNLGLAELLTLLGSVSGLVVALYLLDRSRRKVTVATLRFWRPAEGQPEKRSRRKRIRQPLSLILQLFGLACLLLAIAQIRLGSREPEGSDHILILDTSSWMAARSGRGTLMDEARRTAVAWLRALPPSGRVMLIRADGLATPATSFESNRRAVEAAIAQSNPGSTALDLERAFELARKVRQLHASSAGEVVFVGAGKITDQQAGESGPAIPNLRVLRLEAQIDNRGIRSIGLRRSAGAGRWEVFVRVRNQSDNPGDVRLALGFGGAPVGLRSLTLPPAGEAEATFELRTRAAGWFEARLLGSDGFPGDDRAVIEIPKQPVVRVAVYSDSPEWLRPVLAVTPNVETQYLGTAAYVPNAAADLVILDRFRPQSLPAKDSIWIEPPAGVSPIRVRETVRNARIIRWLGGHRLGDGLRVQDLRLESAEVFEAAKDDIAIAEIPQGPVILARAGTPRMAVLGFHPLRPAMRYQLAAPLLFANIFRWMSPEIFRRWELNAGSTGSITVPLESEADAAQARVLSGDQSPIPFTVQGRTLRFYAGTPGVVRVVTGDREIVYSLTLPEVGTRNWEPPASARRGLPSSGGFAARSRDLWQILALLGGLCVLVDWLWFGCGLAVARQLAGGRFFFEFFSRLRRLYGKLPRRAS